MDQDARLTEGDFMRWASVRQDANPTSLWVVIGLAMGPTVALGLVRFAYALLLPALRAGVQRAARRHRLTPGRRPGVQVATGTGG